MSEKHRAYSVLSIKSVSDEKRIIRGIATTPAPDRHGDIVEPLGVTFKNPLPLLWQHRHDMPVGTVKFDKPTKDGVTFTAEIQKIEEEGELKKIVDLAWHSVKYELVRGVSIGFKILERSYITETTGLHIHKSEVFELSLVTVPANSGTIITATKNLDRDSIAVLKEFDIGAPAASGNKGTSVSLAGKAIPGASGKAKSITLTKQEPKMAKTIAEQIAALEQKRAANAARMEDIMTKSVEEGRSTDADEQEEFDTLQAEISIVDDELKRFRALEKVKMQTAKPIYGQTQEEGTRSRDIKAAVQVKTAKPEAGIRFARFAKCIGLAHKMHRDPITIAEERYKDDPEIATVIKAAVSAASTGNPSWAGNLVGEETSLFADFVEFLRPQTILGRFGANGVPALRRVPFRVPLIGQSSGGAGYWVGEGNAKPLTKFDFTRTTLEPLKVANIAVVTIEVLQNSSPSAEMIVRDQLAAALRERLDLDFIDPNKASVTGISPASILNGVAGIPSSGSDADAVRADIRSLFAAFIAANNAPTTGVFIMKATTALALSLMRNPMGGAEFPDIDMTGGKLLGLPVIVSEYVPADSSGAIVALVNASDIYQSDDGEVSVDMSTEASLQMDNAPSHNSTTPTPAQLVSLWQTNSVGFRAERTINWARRRTTSVAYLTGVNWGQ